MNSHFLFQFSGNGKRFALHTNGNLACDKYNLKFLNRFYFSLTGWSTLQFGLSILSLMSFHTLRHSHTGAADQTSQDLSPSCRVQFYSVRLSGKLLLLLLLVSFASSVCSHINSVAAAQMNHGKLSGCCLLTWRRSEAAGRFVFVY